MNHRLRSALVCGLAVLGLLTTAGCAGRDADGADHCSPRWPKSSDFVVRARQVVTVSVSAATCPVEFSHDRRLTLTAVDHTGRRFPLGSVQAYPSRAFERQVRIPAAASTGPIDVFIDGVELYCPPNASCAAYTTSVLKVDSTPDFSTDPTANAAAAGIAERMGATLERRPSLDQLAIVTDGVQAVLSTDAYDREVAAVKTAFADAQSAAPAGDRATAGAAELHITTSWHSKAQLDRLSARIGNDPAWQQRHRLDLSTWGPDPATGSVRISLRRYSDPAAVLLTGRYGDAVSISTRSTTAVAG